MSPIWRSHLQRYWGKRGQSSAPLCTFSRYMWQSSNYQSLQILNCLMSMQDIVNGWKRVKTATSSIGLHIGRYKASTQQPYLAGLFHLKKVLKRSRCHDYEKAESNGIGDLKMVVLLDSKANHGKKWVGIFTMNTAVQKGNTATEEYNRPRRSTEDHTHNRKLMFDHHKFKRLPLDLACSNLKSCYDRVVHIAVSLAL